MELQQFLPLWANGGEVEDDEGPRNKDVEALARALGKETTDQRPLLGWMQWHVAIDAYALALEVTKALPLTAAMAHKKIVMQVALQAKSRGRTASVRVLFSLPRCRAGRGVSARARVPGAPGTPV